MTESLYLSPDSSLRFLKLLGQLENVLKTDPASGLKMHLVRHNLFDLIRPLPLSSGTRRKTEWLLSLTETGFTRIQRFDSLEKTIRELRDIYQPEIPAAPKTISRTSHAGRTVILSPAD